MYFEDATVIYRKVLTAAKDSRDGETPEVLVLAEEANALILWHASFTDSGTPIRWWKKYQRTAAIEQSVAYASSADPEPTEYADAGQMGEK